MYTYLIDYNSKEETYRILRMEYPVYQQKEFYAGDGQWFFLSSDIELKGKSFRNPAEAAQHLSVLLG